MHRVTPCINKMDADLLMKVIKGSPRRCAPRASSGPGRVQDVCRYVCRLPLLTGLYRDATTLAFHSFNGKILLQMASHNKVLSYRRFHYSERSAGFTLVKLMALIGDNARNTFGSLDRL